MTQIHKLNRNDIFDSVVFDKYCLRVKGASYDSSYLIYLKFFFDKCCLTVIYRDLFSYLIWRGPLLGSNLNICHILDIASPLAIFRCLCEICNFCQKFPFSLHSRIWPKAPFSPQAPLTKQPGDFSSFVSNSPLFKGPLFASRRGLQRIFTTHYNRKSDLIMKRFAYFCLKR